MLFNEILGQEHLKQMVQNSLEKKSFPQSSIIIDKDNYGGLLFALAVSEQLLFDKSKTEGGFLNHPDLHFVFPLFSVKDDATELNKEWLAYIQDNSYPKIMGWKSASNSSGSQASIRTKEIKEMHRVAGLKSFYGKNKVFIIWGGELLMPQAANQLLKILEEPPLNCYFIIVSKSINDVLPTIKSRCQISSLSPIPTELIEEKLKKMRPDLDAKKIASSSMGSWGRSLDKLEEDSVSSNHEQDFVECLRLAFRAKKNKDAVIGLMSWAEKMALLKKEEQKSFLSYCLYITREAMLLGYGASNLASFISNSDFQIEKLAPFVHSKNIIDMVNLIEDSLYSISRNVSSKIVFSTFCLNITKLLAVKED
ncbi:MAG TPA: hypothetical protein QF889_01225 [Flavobacteriaceae bacterium]|nr:hypothetical protein [Flavobacteriaceae bacterium]